MNFAFKTFLYTYATVIVSRIFRPKKIIVFDTLKCEKPSPWGISSMDRKWCEIKNVFEKVFSVDVAMTLHYRSMLQTYLQTLFDRSSTIQSEISPKTYNVFKEFKSIVKSSNRLVQAKSSLKKFFVLNIRFLRVIETRMTQRICIIISQKVILLLFFQRVYFFPRTMARDRLPFDNYK